MTTPAPHPLPSFDALAAHEDRLVRLEDALIESAKQTAELSVCMRSFEGKLETMIDTIGDGLKSLGSELQAQKVQQASVEKRLEALEAKKAADDKAREKWTDVAQKVAVYVATGILGAVGGWLMHVFIGF